MCSILTTDSSVKALAPETPLMKSPDVSNTEHTVYGRGVL